MRSGKLIAGRFLLQEKLGTGPSGASFQGLDQANQQPIVVKLIDAQRVRAKKLPRPFELLSHLDAPLLARPLSSGMDEGFWYVIRALMAGESLEARLWRAPLPWEEALALLQAITEALVPLHQAGITHLGLSSSNILLTTQGSIRLLDAGTSYLEPIFPRLRIRPSTDLQVSLAPEQARGESTATSVDLFSLGAIFYEALTGRAPFVGTYPLAALARLQFQEPTPLQRLVPSAPSWAEALLTKLLAKDPARRPQDASEFLKELAILQQSPPTISSRPRFGEREQQTQVLLILGGRNQTERAEAQRQAESLRKLSRKAGLHEVVFPDGSGIALTTSLPLQERLHKLAQIGLELRNKHPQASLLLAGGQGELLGDLPEGDLSDHAAALLAMEARRSKDKTSGLRVDPLVASLLHKEFAISQDDQGFLLKPSSSLAPLPTLHSNETDPIWQQTVLKDLSLPQRIALRAAAIFGERCWKSGVEEIVGSSIDWSPLLDTNLLHPVLSPQIPDEVELEFTDPSLCRGAYSSLVEEDRRAGHRIAARWSGRVGIDPEYIFTHIERTQENTLLGRFCESMARSALERGEPEKALNWLERGENSGVEPTGSLLSLRLRIQRLLGHRTSARRTALQALEKFPRGSEESFPIQGSLLEICGVVGDFKRIVSIGERLLKSIPSPTTASWTEAACQGALAALRIGELTLMTSLLERLEEPIPWPSSQGYLLLVRSLRATLSGYPAASLHLHRAAAAAFRESLDEAAASSCEAELAQNLWEVGANSEAEALATKVLNRARSLGFTEIEARCKVVLGLVLYRNADLELARSTIREATSFFGGRGSKLFEGEARCALAMILLGSSDLEGARREAERAQGALSTFPFFQIKALLTLARIRLAQGEVEEAQKFCTQVSALGKHLEAVLDLAVLLRPLQAQIAQLHGDREEARKLFLESEQYLTARAADFEDPTLQEAFLRGVPEHARLLQLARLLSILPSMQEDAT